MIFRGITREFSLKDNGQYDTIGAFWDEISAAFGLETLRGLGYGWSDGKIHYAIGLKSGDIDGFNLEIDLPDDGWESVGGRTDDLQKIYDEIYLDGPLLYEIETFLENGDCHIEYIRKRG